MGSGCLLIFNKRVGYEEFLAKKSGCFGNNFLTRVFLRDDKGVFGRQSVFRQRYHVEFCHEASLLFF